MALYLSNGTDVDSSWYGHIAISKDGNTWKTISKTGLSVVPEYSSSGDALAGLTTNTIIYLYDINGEMLEKFECNDVTNQATWNGRTEAALRLAVDDLTTWIGDVFSSGITPSTNNQISQFRSLTVNSTAQAVKASAGNLYGFNIINLHTANIYVKIYNIAAASVNPASSVPVRTLLVPASGAIFQEPSCIINSNTTAISVRAVTGSGDTDTTAPATLPIIELMYK